MVPPDPVIVNCAFSHMSPPPLTDGALGNAYTVTVRFAVASEHPPVPETVYEICEDPAETPVMFPEPSTVATPSSALDHVPPASPPFTVNEVDPVGQTVSVPLSVPASGAAVTVAVTADLLPVVQPPSVASTYYVVVAEIDGVV